MVKSVRIGLNCFTFVCRVFVRHDNKKSWAYASDAGNWVTISKNF